MGFSRDPHRYAVEPISDSPRIPQILGSPGEDHEHGLKCDFGIVAVPEHAAANPVDCRPVATQQEFKSIIVAVEDKSLDQLGIARQIGFMRTHDAT